METNTMHLGQIIKETGDFGRFQIFMTVFMFPTMLVYNWSMMAMAYTATTPNWHCFAPAIGQNENGSLFEENVCSINGTSCDRITFSDDMRTAVSEWDLLCDRKWITNSITTIQMSGLLVGGLLSGHLADGIGRKPVMYIALFMMFSFNLISFFSVNWKMFAAMRFCIGFGLAMTTGVTMEYVRNKWRVYWMMLVPGWAIFGSLLALFCWKIQDWRYIHIVIAVIAGLYMFSWPIVPESFRWLVSHGRIKRAQQTIKYVAKFNRKPVPDLKKLASVIEYEQKEAEKTKALQVYTVLDLFRTSRIRKTTILFSLIWLFSSYSYYGIAFAVQELSGNLYLNLFLLSVVDFPGNILTVILNAWAGRRWTCVAFYVVGGAFALAVGVIKYLGTEGAGSTVNILALLAKLFISAGWDMNSLWSVESFPTVVRNIGGGFISSVSRVGSMVAPQIITLSQDVPGLLYMLSGIVCILSSALCAFLEETKHKDLDDMITNHENAGDVQLAVVENGKVPEKKQ